MKERALAVFELDGESADIHHLPASATIGKLDPCRLVRLGELAGVGHEVAVDVHVGQGALLLQQVEAVLPVQQVHGRLQGEPGEVVAGWGPRNLRAARSLPELGVQLATAHSVVLGALAGMNQAHALANFQPA